MLYEQIEAGEGPFPTPPPRDQVWTLFSRYPHVIWCLRRGSKLHPTPVLHFFIRVCGGGGEGEEKFTQFLSPWFSFLFLLMKKEGERRAESLLTPLFSPLSPLQGVRLVRASFYPPVNCSGMNIHASSPPLGVSPAEEELPMNPCVQNPSFVFHKGSFRSLSLFLSVLEGLRRESKVQFRLRFPLLCPRVLNGRSF